MFISLTLSCLVGEKIWESEKGIYLDVLWLFSCEMEGCNCLANEKVQVSERNSFCFF